MKRQSTQIERFNTMLREYKLIIHALGKDENDAVESAVRMLNAGANFDESELLWEHSEEQIETREC
jgi:hypothetical protein